jgi:hypothetical protein
MKSEWALENNEGYLLLILSGALLSADIQRLTDERVAESRHVPDTLCPNDLSLLVNRLNTLTYSEWLPVVFRPAAALD